MVHGFVVIQRKHGGNGILYPVRSNIKIGRGTHCAIRVHIQSVSEEHSLISVGKGRRARIQNLSSSSTTLVNGLSIGSNEVSLQHEDIISVGGRTFQWMYPEDSQFLKKDDVLLQRRKSSEVDRLGPFCVAANPKRHTLGAPITSSNVSKESKISKEETVLKKKVKGTPVPLAVNSPRRKSSRTPVSILKGRTPKASFSPKCSTPVSFETSRKVPSAKASNIRVQTPKTASSKKPKTPFSGTKSSASKRRLSSPLASTSKRMKIESPKTIDKKKMAALIGIHRKSPWIAASSSQKAKIPVLPSPKLKTPVSSSQKTSAWGVLSSNKKTKRPLFSEILKRAKKANSVKKVAAMPSSRSVKVAPKRQNVKMQYVQEIPKRFQFNSTGHANSPEPIFIGRKVTVTPAITRKGRKEPCFPNQFVKSEAPNFDGLHALFKTPGKTTSVQPLTPAVIKKHLKELCFPNNDLEGESDNYDGLNALFKTPGKRTAEKSPKQSSVSMLSEEVSSPVKIPTSPKSENSKQVSVSSSKKEKNTSVVSLRKSARSPTPLKVQKHFKLAERSTRSMSLGTMAHLSLKARKSRRSLPDNAKRALMSSESKIIDASHPEQNRSFTKSKNDLKSSPWSSVKKKSAVSVQRRPEPQVTSTPAPSSHKQSTKSPKISISSSLSDCHHRSPVPNRQPNIVSAHSFEQSPIKSSLKSSPSKSDSSPRGKSLSVSFNDSVQFQNVDSNGSDAKSGYETPDMTFDFNAVKTPNVPKEMFVSSLFSSGSTSGRSSAGSAKRKITAPRSPRFSSEALLGLKRLMQTPISPAGYVDLQGIKRLMASPSKTPPSLAVEGVQKLFEDASAAGQNSLSSFLGIEELFSSPSPSKSRLSVKSPSYEKPSAVAKILAEVEGMPTPSFEAQALKQSFVVKTTRNSLTPLKSPQDTAKPDLPSLSRRKWSSNTDLQGLEMSKKTRKSSTPLTSPQDTAKSDLPSSSRKKRSLNTDLQGLETSKKTRKSSTPLTSPQDTAKSDLPSSSRRKRSSNTDLQDPETCNTIQTERGMASVGGRRARKAASSNSMKDIPDPEKRISTRGRRQKDVGSSGISSRQDRVKQSDYTAAAPESDSGSKRKTRKGVHKDDKPSVEILSISYQNLSPSSNIAPSVLPVRRTRGRPLPLAKNPDRTSPKELVKRSNRKVTSPQQTTLTSAPSTNDENTTSTRLSAEVKSPVQRVKRGKRKVKSPDSSKTSPAEVPKRVRRNPPSEVKEVMKIEKKNSLNPVNGSPSPSEPRSLRRRAVKNTSPSKLKSKRNTSLQGTESSDVQTSNLSPPKQERTSRARKGISKSQVDEVSPVRSRTLRRGKNVGTSSPGSAKKSAKKKQVTFSQETSKPMKSGDKSTNSKKQASNNSKKKTSSKKSKVEKTSSPVVTISPRKTRSSRK